MQEKAHIFKLSIKDEASIVENISKLYKPELEKRWQIYSRSSWCTL
jgi:hypothetical protein